VIPIHEICAVFLLGAREHFKTFCALVCGLDRVYYFKNFSLSRSVLAPVNCNFPHPSSISPQFPSIPFEGNRSETGRKLLSDNAARTTFPAGSP
jgi:hypothetical protein